MGRRVNKTKKQPKKQLDHNEHIVNCVESMFELVLSYEAKLDTLRDELHKVYGAMNERLHAHVKAFHAQSKPMTATEAQILAENAIKSAAHLNDCFSVDHLGVYRKKVDENKKYVMDCVDNALRLMPGIKCVQGVSWLEYTITYKTNKSITVEFTDKTMGIKFTRRDGERIVQYHTDFGKGATELAAIIMFYCLR